MKPHTPAAAFAVAVSGIATFSVMDAIMKGLVQGIGIYDALFWRNLIGCVVSGALFAWRGPGWPKAAVLKVHVIRGVLIATMALAFFWGLARVPMAQAVALTFIAPLLSLFLAALMLGERIGRTTVLASLVAFAGVIVILVGQARADLGPEAFLGAIAILFSAVCYAFNIVMMRQQALLAGPYEIAFFQSGMMTLTLLPAAPWLAHLPTMAHLPAIGGAAGLALVSSLMLAWAYARAQASYLSATEYTAFVWASLFGFLIYNERLSGFTLAGAAMIVGGCLLASRAKPMPPLAAAEGAT